MSTYAIESAKRASRPVLFMTISGLPYIWWTIKPAWEATTDYTHIGGLSPVDGCVIDSEIDLLGTQVEPASTLTIRVAEDAAGVMRGLAAHGGATAASKCATLQTSALPPVGAGALIVNGTIEDSGASGLLHIGTETMSYGSVSVAGGDETYASVVRGRFHHLDATGLEVAHPTDIRWDAVLDRPPLVSIMPYQMRGRWITLYRTYLDPETGEVLARGEHAVMWRGRVTMMSYVGGSWEISGNSIMAELERSIFASPPSAVVSGWKFRDGEFSDGSSWLSASQHGSAIIDAPYQDQVEEIDINGDSVYPWPNIVKGDEYPDSKLYRRATVEERNPFRARSLKLTPSDYSSVDGIVAAINAWLVAEHAASRLPVLVSLRIDDGRLTITQAAAGLFFATEVVGGEDACYWTGVDPGGTAVPWLRVYTKLNFGTVGTILGLGGEFETVRQLSDDSYYDSAVSWQDGTSGAKHEITVAEGKCLSTYIEIPRAGDRPITVQTDSTGMTPWIDPGDMSQTIIRCEDCGLFEFRGYSHVTGLLSFGLTGDDGVVGTVDSDPISVPIDAPLTEQAVVTQAWRPRSREVIGVSGGGSSEGIVLDGVHVLMLRILLSTGAGIGYGTSAYDRLHASLGLSLPIDFVDSESFEAIQHWCGAQELRRDYVFTGPQRVDELFAGECRLLGIAIVQRAGQIAAVPVHAPSAADAEYDIDDSALLSSSKIQWSSDDHDPVAGMTVEYDLDPITGDYMGVRTELLLADSVDGSRAELMNIQVPGLRRRNWTAVEDVSDPIRLHITDALARATCERWMYRCTCTRALDGVYPGCVVTITDSRIPDPWSGGMGIVDVPAIVARVATGLYAGTIELDCVVFSLARGGNGVLTTAGCVSVADSVSVTASAAQLTAAANPAASLKAGAPVSVYSPASGAMTAATIVSVVGTTVTLDRAVPDGAAVLTHGDIEAQQSSTAPPQVPYISSAGKVIATSSGALKLAPKVWS